jgi:hypothetical protein
MRFVMMTAAVAMHMVIFGSHMVIRHGHSYEYHISSQDTSSWWNVRDIILAVSLATALLCFVLLGVNVVRMKLSRNALDLIVVRFKKELASTVSQVATEKDNVQAQRRLNEKLWRMLETINMCRPMHRDYALATTLADYEVEATPLITNAGNNTVAMNQQSSPTAQRVLENKNGIDVKSFSLQHPTKKHIFLGCPLISSFPLFVCRMI